MSKEYGIITPYTSFLVTEKEERANLRELKGAEVGKKAVTMAQDVMALKEETTAPKTVSGTKYIEGTTYILKNGIWQDINYKGEETEKIEWLSEKYFDLLKAKSLPKILSLGRCVIFKHNENWCQVIE